MARLNTPLKRERVTTHEGGVAVRINHEQQLRRAVMACLLWEEQFYESGEDIASRIGTLTAEVDATVVAKMASEARHQMHLRHVPLLLLAHLSKQGRLKAQMVENVISRADELAELVVIACHVNGIGPDKAKKVLSHPLKDGLAMALHKFNEYQLAKYNRDGAVRLRDVIRLVHPKPINEYEAQLWKRVLDNQLAIPDTWEVALSGGADKKATFERLLREGKLGYLALLRNLRNMEQAGVDRDLVRRAILAREGGADKVLPFRFTAAARHAPSFERELDAALGTTIGALPQLPGRTIILVDVSGSMDHALSGKSDLTRMDAAATLASVVNGEDLQVFTFSARLAQVPARRGMAGVDAVIRSQPHGGTDLVHALAVINTVKHDRLIVITDEQANGRVPTPVCKKAYMINVASYRNGVGYGGNWTHIDGFSENVLRYIVEHEKLEAENVA